MKYFLAKTEPETYSIEDLKKDKFTEWTGVHNFAALKFLKSWEVGDIVIIYHTGEERAIAGLARVAGAPYKDAADARGISWAARLQFVAEFAPVTRVTLAQVKQSGKFADFALVKQGRLSVMDCPENFIEWVNKMGCKFV